MFVVLLAILASIFYGFAGFVTVYGVYMALYFFCSIIAYVFGIGGKSPNNNNDWARRH